VDWRWLASRAMGMETGFFAWGGGRSRNLGEFPVNFLIHFSVVGRAGLCQTRSVGERRTAPRLRLPQKYCLDLSGMISL